MGLNINSHWQYDEKKSILKIKHPYFYIFGTVYEYHI